MTSLRVSIFFKGAAYRFEHLVCENLEEYILATSKEKAISCFKSRVKERLGLIKATDISLSGKLRIKYDNDHIETYRLIKNKIEPVEVMKTPFTKTDSGKVKLPPAVAKLYKKDEVSVEEAKLINILMEEKQTVRFIFVSNDGDREDVTREIESYTPCKYIVLDGDEYIYDVEEGMYWQDGARYSNRIEVRND